VRTRAGGLWNHVLCLQVVGRFLGNPANDLDSLDGHEGPLDVSPIMRKLCSEWIATPQIGSPRIFVVVHKQCLPLLQLFLELPETCHAVIHSYAGPKHLRIFPEGTAVEDGWLPGLKALQAVLRAEDVRCGTTFTGELIKIALRRLKRHHVPVLDFLLKMDDFDGRLDDEGTTVLQYLIKNGAKPKHVHWMLLECGQDPVQIGNGGETPLEAALATGGYWKVLCNVPGINLHLDTALEKVLTGERLPKAAIDDFTESRLFTYVVATTLRLFKQWWFNYGHALGLYATLKAVLCHEAMTEVRLDYVTTEAIKLGLETSTLMNQGAYWVSKALRLGRKALVHRVELTKAKYPPVAKPEWALAPPPAPMTWIPGRAVGVPKRARDF
jgi:hypothetical protein